MEECTENFRLCCKKTDIFYGCGGVESLHILPVDRLRQCFMQRESQKENRIFLEVNFAAIAYILLDYFLIW
jgi:hypothetical protein